MTLHTTLQMNLDGDTDILVRRDFPHPPERVWRALTDPALIPRWIAPGAMTACEIDARPGGSFRYEWGDSFFFSGPVLEADPPRRLVTVEHFNGDTSSGPVVTTTLTPNGTGTSMTILMRYQSEEARAAAVAAGFTDGYDEVYARLDALLA